MSIKLPGKVVKTVSGCTSNFTFYLLEDGTVYSCGNNAYGQLGLNDTTNRSTPTLISLNNVKDISCGSSYTIFLLNDGTVYGCGRNGSGQLGLNDTTNRSTPTKISLTNVKDIACGDDYTIFLLSDGTVYGCGGNSSGQLGLELNNTDNSVTPTLISGINNVKSIACGYNHTIFLLNDGTAYGCGDNEYGQLGLNDTNNRTIPTLISGINNVKSVSCGKNDTLFLLNDGTVYSCGWNGSGQLGLGLNDKTNRTTPILISGINNVKSIACGSSHTLFLLNDRTVYSCGNNDYGQLGLNDKIQRTTPTKISTITNVKNVSCGNAHTLFILNDGTVYSCGNNFYGQLGLGNTTSPILPITLLIEKSNTPYSKLLSILSNNFTVYEVQSDVSIPYLTYALDNSTNLYMQLVETKDSNSSNIKVNSDTKSYFIQKNV